MYVCIFGFSSGKIQIRQSGEGIALHAPSHGLQEVFFDFNKLKVIWFSFALLFLNIQIISILVMAQSKYFFFFFRLKL